VNSNKKTRTSQNYLLDLTNLLILNNVLYAYQRPFDCRTTYQIFVFLFSLCILGSTSKTVGRTVPAILMADFHRHVSVPVSVSVAKYVKSTYFVSVSSPLPFIRSYKIEFYFSVPAVPLGLPPGPATLLPRTRPSSNGIRTAGTDTVFTETVTETDTGTATLCWKSGVSRFCKLAQLLARRRQRTTPHATTKLTPIVLILLLIYCICVDTCR